MNATYRRQMGMGMPTPARDLATERYSITTTSHVKPEPKPLTFQIVLGEWMVNDGSGWRAATPEEIDQFTGVTGWRHPQDAELLDGVVLGFDLERMKKALEGPTISVPAGLSRDEKIAFILAHADTSDSEGGEI